MVKKVEYQVLKSLENVEIRKYPKLLLATVNGLNDNDAFNLLFKYITGSNRTNQKLEMTAPVISSSKVMSFVMPEKYNINDIPQPTNPRVTIEERQSSKIAVIRVKGNASTKDVTRFQNELLNILSKNNIKTQGKPFLMRYNSPFMPGFFRRNEIGINVLD